MENNKIFTEYTEAYLKYIKHGYTHSQSLGLAYNEIKMVEGYDILTSKLTTNE